MFYQGSDRFLRELTIASDGNAKDRAISTVKDARAKTSLAAIVQKDLDRPSSQSAKMPDVLFYQGIDVSAVPFTCMPLTNVFRLEPDMYVLSRTIVTVLTIFRFRQV